MKDRIQSWDLLKDEDLTCVQLHPSGILRIQALILLMVAGVDPFQQIETFIHLEVEIESYYLCAISFLWDACSSFREIHCPEAERRECFRRFQQYFHLPQDGGKEEQLLRGMFGPQDDRNPSRWSSLNHMLESSKPDQNVTFRIGSFRATIGRGVFYTQKGYIGLGPVGAAQGDLLCTLQGFDRPVILRQVDSHYIFVGDCYVPGIMDGEFLEAVKAGEATVSELEIR
jgi:hypothetical protein